MMNWEQTHIESLQQQQSTAAWLRPWQSAHLNAFLRQGFPTRRDEHWKYTDVSIIAQQEYGFSEATDTDVDIKSFLIADTDTIVFVDGSYQPQLSQLQTLPAGVVVQNMLQALHDHPVLLREYLHDSSRQQKVFANLNASLLTDGLFVHVPANIHLQRPLHLLYLSTGKQSLVMRHPRHVFSVEANSELTLFETYHALNQDQSYLNNVVTQWHLSEQACVHYVKWQDESLSSQHIANWHVEQARGSQFNSYHLVTGAALSRDTISVALNESESTCELLGLTALREAQHHDTHSCIDHVASQSSSRQKYKGMYTDRGHGVFNGRIHVVPGVQQIDAHQYNHNLLLSSEAAIDTKPELEIHADDVQCTHGATVGQLDEDALFYLRSRGIENVEAARVLRSAFVDDVLSALPEHESFAILRQRVEHRIGSE